METKKYVQIDLSQTYAESRACINFICEELAECGLPPDYRGLIFLSDYLHIKEVLKFFAGLGTGFEVNYQRNEIRLQSGWRLMLRRPLTLEREVYDYSGLEITTIGFSERAYYLTSTFCLEFLRSRLRSRFTTPKIELFGGSND